MNNSTSPVFKNVVQKNIQSETQTSSYYNLCEIHKEKKGYYGTYLNDGKICFHTDDYAVNIFIPTEWYQKADITFPRMLDEIGEASPTAKTTEELKKELNNEKINLTKLHWIKNKSNTTKVITFQKNHLIC